MSEDNKISNAQQKAVKKYELREHAQKQLGLLRVSVGILKCGIT